MKKIMLLTATCFILIFSACDGTGRKGTPDADTTARTPNGDNVTRTPVDTSTNSTSGGSVDTNSVR